MKTAEELKTLVREKYANVVTGQTEVVSSACCVSTPGDPVYKIMADSYEDLDGYLAEADLGLGCGLPTAFAGIEPGQTVLDLGSGAGNDCFIARHETGPDGKVIGVDFTPEMVTQARINAEKRGYNNVEFRLGDIEELPVSDQSVDVVVSNCVLNLVPNKPRVFAEMFRVLRAGGHFSVSDIVLQGELPDGLREDAEMYAGCVSGAIQKSAYLQMMEVAGFTGIKLQKEKAIHIPREILRKYLSDDALSTWNIPGQGIFSITVFGEKPSVSDKPSKNKRRLNDQSCGCGPGCC